MKKLVILLLFPLFPLNSLCQNLRLEYNKTSTAKTINLGGVYMDMKKVVYPGSITLKPFSSKVLIKMPVPLAIKLEKYEVVAKDNIITILFTLDEDGVSKNYSFTYDNNTQ